MIDHHFGSDGWTESKLAALENYLKAYRLIFTKNPGAQHLRTIYVDAFAGTGSRVEGLQSTENTNQSALFDDEPAMSLPDEYRRGSARIALELESPFDEYIFVDKNPDHVSELKRMIDTDFPNLASRCRVWREDGCEILRELCTHRVWKNQRAVVFLDPYGMNVEWQVLEWVANTRAIDLWLLFPLGMGANRLLKRDGLPNSGFANKLTRVFGTTDWSKFYQKPATGDLFADSPAAQFKQTSFEDIGNFYLTRLSTIFSGVAPRTKVLTNSRGNPMYLLVFASGNPKGAKTAIKIADYLMDA
ncbi:MAG: three-Cys-motif partner protein TcmP [Sulfuritalea sp.]|nr:three-Cys-motif partner protein TcmP [Sulfuritalea sp.]